MKEKELKKNVLNEEELNQVSAGAVSREEELGGKIIVVPGSEVPDVPFKIVPHVSGDDVC